MPDESSQPERSIEEVVSEDGRYHWDAFAFLHEGLARAVHDIHGEEQGPGDHVTGQQLCLSLRDLAVDKYGMMAPAVLRHWGIHESIDFGNMVYLLIDHGFMRKTDDDSVEDFRDVFHLDRDFDITGRIEMK